MYLALVLQTPFEFLILTSRTYYVGLHNYNYSLTSNYKPIICINLRHGQDSEIHYKCTILDKIAFQFISLESLIRFRSSFFSFVEQNQS